jgi:hypothetical protein
MSKFKIKIMLVVFLGIKEIFMAEYVSPRQIVNQKHCITVVKIVRKNLKRLKWWENRWIVHQDNASA